MLVVLCDCCKKKMRVSAEDFYYDRPEAEIPFRLGRRKACFRVELTRWSDEERPRRRRRLPRLNLCRKCVLALLLKNIQGARVRFRSGLRRRRG